MSRSTRSVVLILIASLLTSCAPSQVRAAPTVQYLNEMSPEEFPDDDGEAAFDLKYELFDESTGESFDHETAVTTKPDWHSLLRPAAELRGSGNKAYRPAKPVIEYGVILSGVDGYRENEKKQMRPASTAKMFTAALALKTLGGDYTFKTRVTWQKSLKTSEVAFLRVTGSGDPTLGDAMFKNSDLALRIADAVAEAGVKKLYGDIEFDATDSRWEKRAVPVGWILSGSDPDRPAKYILGSLGKVDRAKLRAALKLNLTKRGVEWTKETAAPFTVSASDSEPKVTVLESTPLRFIVRNFMKWSLNHIGETLLRKIGEVAGARSADNLLEAGLPLLREFANLHVGDNAVTLHDGCGLSRDNRATADALATFLEEMKQEPYFYDFYSAFAVPGDGGSLQNWKLESKAQKAIHGKTGTLERPAGAFQIAGYLEEVSQGERIYHPFVILTETKTEDQARAYCRKAQKKVLSTWARLMLN